MLTTLGIYTAAYCVIHSVLADDYLMSRIYRRWWYRFFYIVQSVLLLIPLLYFYVNADSSYVFNPPLVFKIILYSFSAAGLLFGLYAASSYDNMHFLGLKQLRERNIKQEQETYTEFTSKGALHFVRHPYYLTGLILLWSRPYQVRDIVINIVFTIYFIAGAYNEERKLKRKFGSEYREYRNKVPMFIPFIK